jgi:hypothetical protein
VLRKDYLIMAGHQTQRHISVGLFNPKQLANQTKPPVLGRGHEGAGQAFLSEY